MSAVPNRSAATCQYGVFSVRCGAPATSKRPATVGERWDVCDHHAAFLDRLRTSIREHAPLLDRLRDETSSAIGSVPEPMIRVPNPLFEVAVEHRARQLCARAEPHEVEEHCHLHESLAPARQPVAEPEPEPRGVAAVIDRTIRCDVDVELMQYMGSDSAIVAAAKVSTRGSASAEDFDAEAGAGLINFLMKNRHGTPFEHNAMTFLISAPIFVFREFHRHRIGWSYNEESGRYKQLDPVFYVPGADRALVQVGKPGHYTYVPGTPDQTLSQVERMANVYHVAYNAYEAALAAGVAREVARAVLPVAIFSSMYATCNARSLMAFLSLRTKRENSTFPSFPQREIEMVAEKMEAEFERLFPITHAAFCEHGRVCP